MIDRNYLNIKFGIDGVLSFEEGENNLIFLNITNVYGDAKICLYGAHLTSYKPHGSKEILWMSPDSNFEVGKPIRGGIPVCFPWFGPHKTDPQKPQHGFGRLFYWDVTETAVKPNGETWVKLSLCASEATKTYWPHDFCAELTISLGKTLEVTLKVTNTSDIAFDYSCALHTYYYLSDIKDITICGLENTNYHNHLEPGILLQESSKLKIDQHETRHYHETEAPCMIEDPGFNRKISVAKSGSKITTVWNPWTEACSGISDLPDDAYTTFICIEAVNSFENTIYLQPKDSHETTAIIGLAE